MANFAGMKTRHLLFWLLLMSCMSASAQRLLVVADLETELPVAQASVLGMEHGLQTDSLGRIEVSDSVRTLLFSHVNYESRIVNLDEVRDTVFLVSKYLSVREVVVFGKGRMPNDELDDLKKQLRLNRTEAQLVAADPGKAFSLPLGKLIPKKWRKGYRAEQRRKRHQELLDSY